jgi:hypothetical protein
MRTRGVIVTVVSLTVVGMAYAATPPVGFERATLDAAPESAADLGKTDDDYRLATCKASDDKTKVNPEPFRSPRTRRRACVSAACGIDSTAGGAPRWSRLSVAR